MSRTEILRAIRRPLHTTSADVHPWNELARVDCSTCAAEPDLLITTTDGGQLCAECAIEAFGADEIAAVRYRLETSSAFADKCRMLLQSHIELPARQYGDRTLKPATTMGPLRPVSPSLWVSDPPKAREVSQHRFDTFCRTVDLAELRGKLRDDDACDLRALARKVHTPPGLVT